MSYLIDLGGTIGSGFFVKGLAAEDLGNRALVQVNTNGTWSPTDAMGALTMPAIGVTMEPIPAGMYGQILIKGAIGLPSWTWNVGERIYASEVTAGEITQTAPANPLYIVQELGFATDATHIYFSPRQVSGSAGATYTKTVPIAAEVFSKPAANSPAVVDKDNVTLYSFTVNTSISTYKLSVPSDYASGGLKISVVWTNDDDTDDLNNNIRAQLDYQVSSEGEVIDGNHDNSPKNVDDAYTSNLGSVDCRTDYMTIADADFNADDCIFLKLSFVDASVTVLSCNPHLIGVCLQYTAFCEGHS